MHRIFGAISGFLFVIVFTNGVGCCGSPVKTSYPPGAYRLHGAMKHLAIEGGCWQFTSDAGDHYQLAGPKADSLLRDGLQATLVVRNLRAVASICMSGTVVEVLEIIDISQP